MSSTWRTSSGVLDAMLRPGSVGMHHCAHATNDVAALPKNLGWHWDPRYQWTSLWPADPGNGPRQPFDGHDNCPATSWRTLQPPVAGIPAGCRGPTAIGHANPCNQFRHLDEQGNPKSDATASSPGGSTDTGEGWGSPVLQRQSSHTTLRLTQPRMSAGLRPPFRPRQMRWFWCVFCS